MLLGWHVDANIAKRLSLVYGNISSLSAQVFGYHCDHTRQVTPAHRRDSVQNSVEQFFASVDRPDIPDQAEDWGLAGEEIEEIGLGRAFTCGSYIRALETSLLAPLDAPLVSQYVPSSFARCGYTPEHVLPFLLDLFASAPRSWSVAWIGAPGQLFELFSKGWRQLGFRGNLLLASDSSDPATDVLRTTSPWAKRMTSSALFEAADAFIFDFARSNGEALTPKTEAADAAAAKQLVTQLHAVIEAEQSRRVSGLPLRRVIGINATHNRFDEIFATYINVARTPFSMRIRHGYVDLGQNTVVTPSPTDGALTVEDPGDDWLGKMRPGKAGERVGAMIRNCCRHAGYVARGPYGHPLSGRYVVRIDLKRLSDTSGGLTDRLGSSIVGSMTWLLHGLIGVQRGFWLESRVWRRVWRRVRAAALLGVPGPQSRNCHERADPQQPGSGWIADCQRDL